MRVAVNSGPLMALAKLQVLHLFPGLYVATLVPSPVNEEVVTQGLAAGHADATAVRLAVARGWLEVVHLPDSALSRAVSELPLGIGERAVIQLAINES